MTRKFMLLGAMASLLVGGASQAGEVAKQPAALSPNAYVISYRLPSSSTAPNYLAQHQAAEQLVARNQAPLVDMVREISALSLRESTLKPSEKTAGSVWFERDSRSRQLVLHVPVGDLIFEFPFSLNREK